MCYSALMNYRVGLVLVVMLFVVPISALALVTCRDTNKGCTLEQLTQLNKDAGALGLAISDRISILQEIIGKLTAQITVLQSGGGTNVSNTACLDLKYGLVIGSTDAATGGEVSKLQKFLLDNGYGDPDGDSGFLLQRATGYYGAQTATAVVKWQKAHGMDFVTTKSGVGPMTRAKMKCGMPVAAQCAKYDDPPVITSITPTSGPVGTTIMVNGCNFQGFEGDKVIWF